ncbi:unnamed protein product [Dibothriocephalus latus]|uniref:Uncharacterized protein n=1 Tax=Dibothriocephalus latus TaxID=60516 RepID=A0A3P7QZ52_DIBLA|nr:unnamed protein product [Dibothriocephalus latus]
MPQGNVGTSSSVFFDQIRSCRLSPEVIRKLHLTFPRSLRNHRYGAVPLEYSSLDEFAWRQADSLRKEEFFDEPASFDWDIDMQHYEDNGSGGGSSLFSCRPQQGGVDLDSCQLMEMQGIEAGASSVAPSRPSRNKPSHGKVR